MKHNIPRYRVRVSSIFMGIMAAMAVTSSAITFPEKTDLALEWNIAFPATAAGGTGVKVVVPHYNRFGLIIPDAALAGVYNEAGDAVRWCFITSAPMAVQGRILCFEAVPGQRYFSFWRRDGKKPALSKKTQGKTNDLSCRPQDLESGLTATPGLMYRPLIWSQEKGVMRQNTASPNVFQMTVPQFDDFELTVRIKLGTARYAGIILRAADPARPDSTGLYWLIARGAGPDSRGENALWGIVRDAQPGPMLNPTNWNELRAVVTGQVATLFLNGEQCKQVSLPPDQGIRGSIGMATYGGTADFDDIVVRDVRSGRTIFEDTFDDGNGLDPAHWVDTDGSIRGGYFRAQALNTTNTIDFAFNLSFHRDPWGYRSGLRTEPTGYTPWVWVPGIKTHTPMTIMLSRTTSDPPARVEFAADLTGRHVLRQLPLRPSSVNPGARVECCVEVHPVEFAVPGSIKTAEEISQATLDTVKAMSFKGRAPERFPIGYASGHRNDYLAGRRLGFNAVHATPGSINKAFFDELGFRYIYSYTHLLTAYGKGVGYRRAINTNEMNRMADQWRQNGLLEKVYRISVFDEPGDDVAGHIRNLKEQYIMQGDPDAWRQMMTLAGLRPQDFIDPTNPPPAALTPDQTNFWNHVRMRTINDRDTDPAGILRTMQLWAASYPTRFGNARAAIRGAFGTNVLVTANVHDSHYFRGVMSDVEPWFMYSQHESLDVPQACDYYSGFPIADEFMVDIMRSALKPHDKPVDIYLAAQSSYFTRSPRSLQLRAFSAIGAGARSMTFYEYGPRYLSTENWYDNDPDRLQAIGNISHAVGWVEDILTTGRPRPAPIAILYGRVSDLWDSLDIGGSLYAGERRNVYYILRQGHLDVDFLCDAWLPPPDELDRFKVIIMAQRCLSPKAADTLLQWVERGGTLMALLGNGRLNDLAQPQKTMMKAFGLAQLVVDEGTDKDRRSSPPPSRRIGPEGGPETKGPIASNVVAVKSATILEKFEDGRPAVIQQTRGKGRLIYAAFLPGHSYHKGVTLDNDVLLGMQEAIRTMLLQWLPPGITPMCKTDHPLVSARFIDSPAGGAVVLINSTGRATVDKVVVTVHTDRYTRGKSLEKGDLVFRRQGAFLEGELSMGLTDIIRLE